MASVATAGAPRSRQGCVHAFGATKQDSFARARKAAACPSSALLSNRPEIQLQAPPASSPRLSRQTTRRRTHLLVFVSLARWNAHVPRIPRAISFPGIARPSRRSRRMMKRRGEAKSSQAGDAKARSNARRETNTQLRKARGEEGQLGRVIVQSRPCHIIYTSRARQGSSSSQSRRPARFPSKWKAGGDAFLAEMF